MGAQRLANAEARNEATTTRAALENLARTGQSIVNLQREAVKELREGWRLHVREDSRVAGEEIARAFGAQIATGLQQQLSGLGAAVQRISRRVGWTSVVKWIAGIGFGIALTIGVGVWALLPRMDGIPWTYVWAGATRLRSCSVGKEAHVCIATDDNPHLGKDANGESIVVVRGM
jgi:hypothetical protein